MKNKKTAAGVIISFLIVLVFVTTIHTVVVFRMTAEETRNSGTYQLESIVAELEKGINAGKNLTFELAIMAQPLTYDRNALEKYVLEKKESIYEQSGGMGFNVYVASDDWAIIPGLDSSDNYVITERPWYRGAIEYPGSLFVSDPYEDVVTQDICYTVSTKLTGSNIVLAVDFSLSKIQEEIEKISISSNNMAVLVTGDGVIAGCRDKERVGEYLVDSFPDYAGIFNLVKASDETVSARINHGLFSDNLFATGNDSGWYLIVCVNDWELYNNSYLWLLAAIILNITLFAMIFVLYYISKKNEAKAQEALESKEKFLQAVSGDLKAPLNTIINNSTSKAYDEDKNYEARFEAIQDATKQLSESIQQIISYSNYVKEEQQKVTKQSARKFARVSGRFRNIILSLMTLTMVISVLSISWMTSRWCKERMEHMVDEYDNQVAEWVTTQKSILDMFCAHISTDPDILRDYDETIAYLDRITSMYDQISATYIGNKEFTPTIYMNNGWVPDDDFVIENRQWYIDTINANDDCSITGPYVDAQTGLYCLTMAQKIYDNRTGQFLGVFGIDFYMDKLIEILGKSYSNDSYAFLTDNRGNIINHPNGKYQMRKGKTVNVASLPYAKADSDEGNISIIKDYDNDYKVLIAERNALSGFKVYIAFDFMSIYGKTILYGSIAFLTSVICIIIVYRLLGGLITWQEDMNRQLQDAADSAIAAGKAKGDFLAMMSHEIRTPINAIIGMNEMILRESPSDDIKGYSLKIGSASKTLLSLINSILDFSKIEEGKLDIIDANYETRALLTDIITMIRPRFKTKDLKLILDIDPDLPRGLYGDDVRIKQIILNIMTNAVKYTEKGSVTLTVKGESISKDQVMISVSVADTGIGIRDADINKLNALFQRLDEKRNRNIEGTGLGIAIVTSLLEMMGSHLEVKSVYGEGSEFSFDLKQRVTDWGYIGEFDESTFVTEQEKTADKFLVAERADVLVVDDNDMNLAVIEGLLKRNKIVPDFATSGMMCIDTVRNKHYDIILLDHMMPEMDGIETLQILKKDNLLRKDTTVIALTANAVVGAREEYLAAGFDDYLSKPVDPAALEKTLAKYLPAFKCSYEEIDRRYVAAPKEEIKKADISTASAEALEESDIIEFMPTHMPEEARDETAENRSTMEKLSALKYLDTEEAISLCGSEDAYITILQMFVRNAEIKKKRIRQLYENKDIKNYIIELHALKSSAKLLGAEEFSELARELEIAGKENNISVIEDKTEDVFVWYDRIENEISLILN